MHKFISSAIGIIVGTFFWYAIGWFLSAQPNPMYWPVYGKICFLLAMMGLVYNTIDAAEKDND